MTLESEQLMMIAYGCWPSSAVFRKLYSLALSYCDEFVQVGMIVSPLSNISHLKPSQINSLSLGHLDQFFIRCVFNIN